MVKKISHLLLLCCILAASLSACKNPIPGADTAPVPPELVSEPASAAADALPSVSLLSADACLNNTPGEAECKDCCDSLETDGAGRKACRDTCPGHDFSQNSNIIPVDITSVLGPDGDYSACTSSGGQGACKECCDSSTALQNGDRRFCRDACNLLPDSGKPKQAPPENAPAQGAAQPEAVLSPLAGEYIFTEGPAADTQGNVFFSDISAGRIYKWSPDGRVDVFLNGLNAPNGLAFSPDGLLIACEGGNGRLISIDAQGQVTPLVEQYNQTRFNEPNDLWIDPQGGIYFTDPVYQSSLVQDGEHVYYLTPDRSQVIRVISDLIRPNGIIGTADGKTLYVADHGAGLTFVYTIQGAGKLSDKRLFASLGSDGMALDKAGRLYLTTQGAVMILDASGNLVQEIKIPQEPTNVVFGGVGGNTLFITARSAVYTFQMPGDDLASIGNPSPSSDPAVISNMGSFTLTSPDVVEAGALPTEYTCDGASATLPITWSGAPAGTVSYALVMHHVASPDDTHWYWVLYDIPAAVTGLTKNSSGIGILGTNSVNGKTEYAPPCSKGPRRKGLHLHLIYTLGTTTVFRARFQVNREVLLAAIQDITLASTVLNVTYTRK